MKGKTIFKTAALAPLACAALMMSCSEQDIPVDVVNTVDGKIQFLPGTDNHLAGRATPVTGANYLDTDLVPDMKVWAFFAKDAAAGSGITPSAQYVGQAGDGVTISNVSSGGTAKWDYANPDETAYWPSQPLDFLAMIPAIDPSFTATAEVTNDVAKATAEVNVPTDQARQKDILFAYAQGLSGRTAQANDPVSLTFSHALSQVTFSGKVKASNVTVDVNSITINNVDAKGTVGFTSDDSSIPLIGSNPATGVERLTASYAPGLVASPTLSGDADIDQAKNLTASDGALMLIPQIRTSDKWEPTSQTIAQADANNATYLTVSCKIKAGDVYLVGNDADYSNIYLPLDINWEPGKHYDYTIVFGAANDNGGGYDDNGNPSDQLLPVSYSVIATNDWTPAVDPTDYEDEWPQEPKPATNVMAYTIRTTSANEWVDHPFVTGDCPAALSIDWGDGQKLENVTSIDIRRHAYESPGDYTVTITSQEKNPAKPQVPKYFAYTEKGSFPKQLTRILTPLLNPGVTTLTRVFYECSNLTEIPAGLFVHCSEVTSFYQAFKGCTGLTAIPAGLFDNCPEVTDFAGTFRECTSLTEIPDGLFDHCTKVTTFGSVFSTCTGLTEIPAGLFDNCTEVKTFEEVFNGCSSLTAIPAGLFDNFTKATAFTRAFYGCTSLTEIPASLFDNCTNVQSFQYLFWGCSGITSAVPELWDKAKWPKVNTYNHFERGCFGGCTNAANYDDIPSGWK